MALSTAHARKPVLCRLEETVGRMEKEPEYRSGTRQIFSLGIYTPSPETRPTATLSVIPALGLDI